ncbi:antitoxin VapB family protein [Nitrospira sp. M1]
MAVKTITIDMEAYTLLASRKKHGQSFSSVIKESLGGKATAKVLLQLLPSFDVEESTLDHIEEQVANRKKHPVKAPRL